MGFTETLLTALSIAIVLPIVFAVFLFFKKRGEKRMENGERVVTRPPKTLSGFFLGFALLVLVGGVAGIVICCITDRENTTADKVIVIALCVALFFAIGFFGYLYIRFNYLAADGEGITVYRLFRKTKFYRYEDIACFHDQTALGMYGGLTGYGKGNKKLFAVEAVHIGTSAIAQKLREHGVHEKGKTYIR